MFPLLNKIKFIVAIVFFIFMIQCSTSSPVESDKLVQLIERLDRMLTKMGPMESREVENLTERLDRMQTTVDYENVQLTKRLNEMQTKMDAENDKWTKKFSDLEAENEKLKTQKLPQDQEEKWTKKLDDLEAEIEKLKAAKLQQDEEIKHLKIQISLSNFSISAFKQDEGQPPSRFLSSPPTSCQELKDNNYLHPMDGLHLLKKGGKIQVAFCTFISGNNPVSETVIGKVDVKTEIVHFYVQRNNSFEAHNVVIPFELARLNEGGAFNLSSGIFTIPVPGIYHFDFSAVTSSEATYLVTYLQVNGVNVGNAYTGRSDTGSWDVVSLSASLRLVAGDRVNMYIYSGELRDSYDHKTHFTGWLVEEDLM